MVTATRASSTTTRSGSSTRLRGHPARHASGREAYTTLETKFNLVRPITANGEVRAEGSDPPGAMATSEARLTGPDGKLLAHGTSTCMIFESD